MISSSFPYRSGSIFYQQWLPTELILHRKFAGYLRRFGKITAAAIAMLVDLNTHNMSCVLVRMRRYSGMGPHEI